MSETRGQLNGFKDASESATIKAGKTTQTVAWVTMVLSLVVGFVPQVREFVLALTPDQYDPIVVAGFAFIISVINYFTGRAAVQGRIAARQQIKVKAKTK